VKRTIAACAALLALVACDPGYFARFPVDTSGAASPLEAALASFEKDGLSGFHRVEVSDERASDYREQGYRVLRWYDRDAEITTGRGSFIYLVVIEEIGSSRIELDAVAFPSLGEPQQLERVRLGLSRSLCERGFRVKDAC
jgi:hypothetical protein